MQKYSSVAIFGNGMMARCCARLLSREKIKTTMISASRNVEPAVMLGEPTLRLLADCLGESPDLSRYHPIARRIVAWGTSEVVAVQHRGLAFGPGELRDAFPSPCKEATSDTNTSFRILTTAPFPESARHTFGHRGAVAARVALLRPDESDACWVESLDQGWLFLIPTSRNNGWLLGVGGGLDDLLSYSRHLPSRISVTEPARPPLETAPRILDRMMGTDWLAGGTEAIAFDPLCGDGTGQAIREAILATAVIQALSDRELSETSRKEVEVHYHSLLVASMRRHLRLCAEFYHSGGNTGWWQKQTATLTTGFEWCTHQLARLPEPRYELCDFRLIRRSIA